MVYGYFLCCINGLIIFFSKKKKFSTLCLAIYINFTEYNFDFFPKFVCSFSGIKQKWENFVSYLFNTSEKKVLYILNRNVCSAYRIPVLRIKIVLILFILVFNFFLFIVLYSTTTSTIHVTY